MQGCLRIFFFKKQMAVSGIRSIDLKELRHMGRIIHMRSPYVASYVKTLISPLPHTADIRTVCHKCCPFPSVPHSSSSDFVQLLDFIIRYNMQTVSHICGPYVGLASGHLKPTKLALKQ